MYNPKTTEMKTTSLSKEELRSIYGGKKENASVNEMAQGFLCRVVDKDGTVREKITTTAQECLEFAGMNL